MTRSSRRRKCGNSSARCVSSNACWARKRSRTRSSERRWRSRSQKTLIARTVAARGGFPMKTIADTLGVARSNLIEQVHRPSRRRSAYRKADDAWLLPLIRAIVDDRPTYGYRRVGALLNRQVAVLGKPPVNHKRVYRLMRQNGFLLACHTGTGRQQTHEGVVRTLRSNLRWRSWTAASRM